MKPGDDIAIIGPGPIGLFGVMLARACGAGKVIAIGLKKDQGRLVKAEEFGAVPIIAEEGKSEKEVLSLTGGKGVDIAMDVSGGKDSFTVATRIVKKGGQIALVGLSPESVFNPIVVVDKELSIHGSFRRQPSTWFRAINLVANRVINPRAIITHVLPLEAAEEGFQMLKRGEAVKTILVP
jgi:threonine dehydrogenase-like Zn-dependent dehydrogenase